MKVTDKERDACADVAILASRHPNPNKPLQLNIIGPRCLSEREPVHQEHCIWI
jgi:hypothetical protein